MDEKFQHNVAHTSEEIAFKERTIGLVTAEEFKRAAAGISFNLTAEEQERAAADASNQVKRAQLEQRIRQKEVKKKEKQKKKQMCSLSFAGGEEEELLGEENIASTGLTKDPHVDTSFLPDKQREQQYEAERQRWKAEWLAAQKQMKEEKLEITYSYWDGTGHRRTVVVKKGDTVGEFLALVRRDLAKDFRELQTAKGDLMYVKEDLILPHDITFYDLIVTKARGKSGPLFHFDVHEDIRIGAVDSRVEKDESHPGKVVERKWYDRNKHIFPASRWEIFDPDKDYGKYTIHGGVVHTK
jgi:protein FAM50